MDLNCVGRPWAFSCHARFRALCNKLVGGLGNAELDMQRAECGFELPCCQALAVFFFSPPEARGKFQTSLIALVGLWADRVTCTLFFNVGSARHMSNLLVRSWMYVNGH